MMSVSMAVDDCGNRERPTSLATDRHQPPSYPYTGSFSRAFDKTGGMMMMVTATKQLRVGFANQNSADVPALWPQGSSSDPPSNTAGAPAV